MLHALIPMVLVYILMLIIRQDFWDTTWPFLILVPVYLLSCFIKKKMDEKKAYS